MNYETEYLFHLFSCGVFGIPAEPPKKDVDWENIISVASEQSVTYIVGMALKNSDTGCPESIKKRVVASTLGGSLKNVIRLSGILEILSRMERAGIHVTVLKGISVAKYYKNPECRVSADIDLLVSPSSENDALEFLKNEGFRIQPRKPVTNHSVCTHPELGIAELHISLWENGLEDVVLKNSDIKKLPVKDRQSHYLDYDYYELDADINLMLLTTHLLKHFVIGGVSMRMIADIALFLKYKSAEADTGLCAEYLKKTGYFYTMQVILGFAVKYFGFSKEDFPFEVSENEDDINMLADDLETGGFEGLKEEEERYGAVYYYRNKSALTESNGKKRIFKILSGNFLSVLHGIFLPVAEMQKIYPVLKKHRWLYPFCMVHRIITRGFSALTHKSFKNPELVLNEEKLSDESKKRVEMFRRFGLIK